MINLITSEDLATITKIDKQSKCADERATCDYGSKPLQLIRAANLLFGYTTVLYIKLG